NVVTAVTGGETNQQDKVKIESLEFREQELESQISYRSAQLRPQLPPINLANVQMAVPKDATLIEFAVYHPYDSTTLKFGKSRYVAYLLSHAGEPKWTDLGESESIDKLITLLRKVLRERHSSIDAEVKPLARQLDEKVMRPIRVLLGDKKRLLISPD